MVEDGEKIEGGIGWWWSLDWIEILRCLGGGLLVGWKEKVYGFEGDEIVLELVYISL